MSQSAPLIELCEITRRDTKVQRTILDHVSLRIDAGERIGLVGPSGSGKSSLLRAIAKLDPTESGTLLHCGQPVERDLVPPYRRRVIYLAQHGGFLGTTVRENLELPFQLASSDVGFDLRRAEQWLTYFAKPGSFVDQSIDSLSGGERQMIALVRALSMDAVVLLLDEPTASLDATAAGQYEHLVLEWFRDDSEHRAFLWVGHDLDQISRMTSRQIEMNQGRIV